MEAMRPMMITSVSEVARMSDLLNRCLVVRLPLIDSKKRKTEEDLRESFERERPALLGALLDCVSMGLKNLPTTKLASLPRMADFARWAVATEPAVTGIENIGAFLVAYDRNREVAHRIALEASPIYKPLQTCINRNGGLWEGTAGELMDKLNELDPNSKRVPGWPKTPRYLAGHLNSIAMDLRTVGFNVYSYQEPGTNSRKMWRFVSPEFSLVRSM